MKGSFCNDDIGSFRCFDCLKQSGVRFFDVLRTDFNNFGRGQGYYVRQNTLIVLPDELSGIMHIDHGFSIIGRHIYLYEGFWFDGASGPAVDGPTNIMAAAIHDALYRILASRHGKQLDALTYKLADETYRRVMIAQGALPIRAYLHYIGLRIGGRRYSELSNMVGRIFSLKGDSHDPTHGQREAGTGGVRPSGEQDGGG
jgi:hypothetical protein